MLEIIKAVSLLSLWILGWVTFIALCRIFVKAVFDQIDR